MRGLEEAIELSKDCCEKKNLLVYAVSYGRSYDGEPDQTSLVCANCRTAYSWSSDEQVARKSGDRKLSDEDLYETINLYAWFWKDTKNSSPRYYESFIKNLGLDKGRVEKVIRSLELYLEYGYRVENEDDLKAEGVTLGFLINFEELSNANANSVEKLEQTIDKASKAIKPYKLMAEARRKLETQNELVWDCNSNFSHKVLVIGLTVLFAK